jgi:TonB family protein
MKDDEIQSDAASPPSRPRFESRSGRSVLTPVLVLVLWVFCLTVGWLGFVLPYERSKIVCLCEEPVQFEKLEVELTEPDTPPAQPPPDSNAPSPPPDVLTPPPLVQPSSPVPPAAPSAPPVVAVAPSPAVAFALPVVNPTRVVQVATAASYHVPAAGAKTGSVGAAASIPAPDKRSLTPRVRPDPDYPEIASREGQEGTVVLRVTIQPDGRVKFAEVAQPSPYQLLDEEAVLTVTRKWRWPAWPHGLRVIEQPIRFENPNRRLKLTSQP